MRKHFFGLAVSCLGTLIAVVTSRVASATVTVDRSECGAVVKINGQMFAEYRTRSGHQPAVWPLIGPSGIAMTRSYPAGPLLEGEMNDHTHHQSLWFAHGNVNGHDFWTNREQSNQNTEIRHREFVTTISGEKGEIVTRNDWLNEGQIVLEDERMLIFGENEFGRYIDFQITLQASTSDVTFGDSKEGAFSVRANAPLTVDSKKGAHLTNSRGMLDENVWGMFADWIDDYGQVQDRVMGIAIFSHPNNFRHPCRWHARTYGLLAANPFGESEFPIDTGHERQQPKTILKGEKLRLRYRVVLHVGDPTEANIKKAYDEFINE